MATATIVNADCLDWLRTQPDCSINCCVTSPPYWGLRDYGVQGQLGLESTPDEYVSMLVEVFREVRRVLRDDGTLWLNLGDSYNNFRSQMGPGQAVHGRDKLNGKPAVLSKSRGTPGLKEKDLCGIPWMVAFALQADGWWLRQDIIWAKPNPMPESVRDRCTKSHEYIFLLSKSARYYFDADAIAEPCAESSLERWDQDIDNQEGSSRVPGKTNGNMKAVGGPRSHKGSKFHTGKTGEHQQCRASSKPRKPNGGASFGKQNHSTEGTGAQSRTYDRPVYETRNKRSVWTVPTKSYKGAHFATFPPKLIEPCILAGCPEGGTVLDPFVGSGTTLEVAIQYNRNAIGIELNAKYVRLAKGRVREVQRFLKEETQ